MGWCRDGDQFSLQVKGAWHTEARSQVRASQVGKQRLLWNLNKIYITLAVYVENVASSVDIHSRLKYSTVQNLAICYGIVTGPNRPYLTQPVVVLYILYCTCLRPNCYCLDKFSWRVLK